MRKLGKLSLMAAAVALALTGCSGGTESVAPDSSDKGGFKDEAAVAGLGGADAAAEFETLYQAVNEAGQSTINLYTPLTPSWPALFEAFQARFSGLSVEPLAIVGAELNTRVTQEQSSGQRIADVVISGDTGVVALADQGVFAGFVPFNGEELAANPRLSLEDDSVTAVAATPRGFMYDTRVDIKPPASWEDLLDSRFTGKMAMTNPATDGGGLQMTDLLLNDDEFGEDYLEKLNGQELITASNTAECHNMVVQGRAFLCIVGGMANYQTLEREGAPLEFVYPIEDGNWATYFLAGIVDEAPNQLAAELFVSWLNTPEANEIKAELGQAPVTNDADLKLPFKSLSEIEMLPSPDLADVAARQLEGQPTIARIFG